MCGAWLCHTWIFSLGIELLILSLLAGLGAVLNAVICRIWGEGDQGAAIDDRSMTAEESTNSRAA